MIKESLVGSDKKIETRNAGGVIAPWFVANKPVIDPLLAAKFALDFGIASSLTFDPEYAGLTYCRRLGLDLESAVRMQANTTYPKSALDLVEYFHPQSVTEFRRVATEEKQKAVARDENLLQLEGDLLAHEGITPPACKTLDEYCEWVSGFTNAEQTYSSSYPEYIRSQRTPAVIKWNLRRHYSAIEFGSRRSFNPLQDWDDFISDGKDLLAGNAWGLCGFGIKDLCFALDYRERGIDDYLLIPRKDFKISPLLTRTMSVDDASLDISTGYFNNYRVNLSSGRVISGGKSDEVVFIFPSKHLMKIYDLKPYEEPSLGYENEIRAYEPISLKLCIGCIPVTDALFPDIQASADESVAQGEKTLLRWGKNYRKNGILWTDDEFDQIRAIAA